MKILRISFILFILAVISCEYGGMGTPDEVVENKDLREIIADGKLSVLTDYSSTDYYILNGQPMGYQYEMLQNLAEHLGVRLEVSISHDIEKSIEMLNNGEADLIAQSLIITTLRKQEVAFTIPFMSSRQVLVQRKPDTWRSMGRDELEAEMVTSPLELAGKSVYVRKGSASVGRLDNLSEEIGESINVVPVDKNKEELIRLVSTGEILYAVMDEQFARIIANNYPDLDISTGIGLEQNMAWAVRQGSPLLLGELNTWLNGFLQTSRYKNIYARYYIKGNRNAETSGNYYTIDAGRISPFDDSIRKYSSVIGWDWRLLTSLIYQESRFNANVTSWAGAFGLMQLMPLTAKRFGVQPDSPPVDHIRAGTEFLKWLDNHYSDIQNPEERIKFVLAAYNIGPGHIDDARNLARKNYANPDVWEDNVDIYLLSKSLPEFYNDPVVKHGYCRGEETYSYVTEVLERFKHYKNLVPESK